MNNKTASFWGSKQECENVNYSKENVTIITLSHGTSWGFGAYARKVKGQIERLCKKKGHHVSVECKPSVPLSFEVSVNNKIVHSKLKGQGFISTKEKLYFDWLVLLVGFFQSSLTGITFEFVREKRLKFNEKWIFCM